MSSHCGPSRRGQRVGAWNAATACPSVDCMSLCRLCRPAQRQAPRGDVTGAGESGGEHNTTPRLRWRVPRQAYAASRRCAGESDGKHRAMHTSCAGEGYGEHNATPRVTLECTASSVCNAAGYVGESSGEHNAAPRVTLECTASSACNAAGYAGENDGKYSCDAVGYAGESGGEHNATPRQAHATPRVTLECAASSACNAAGRTAECG